MKTLYVECKMGAAGDMLQAALYELLEESQKQLFLNTMNHLFEGQITVNAEPASQCGITGTHMRVEVWGQEEHEHLHHHEHEHTHEHHHDHVHTHEHDHVHTHEHDHVHEHKHEHMHEHTHEHIHEQIHEHAQEHHHHGGHAHYSFHSICHLIDDLPLDTEILKNAKAVYQLIGDAEAKAHNSTLDNIHFHEVGSMDAVADVTGVCLLLHMLDIEQIIVSPIHVGNGTVHCAHGILPVPAPATAEILKGIPYYTGSIPSELCTPTGASLLRHFATGFGDMPLMKVDKVGIGLGTKVFPVANMVRVFLGETTESASPDLHKDEILEINCNLDDMTGEELGYAMDLLLDAGALDVFYQPIYMKKNRPGVILTCFCKPSEKERFALLILKNTSTRGVRFQYHKRMKLDSTFSEIKTPYGTIHEKISRGYGIEKRKLEYEDLKNASSRSGLSIAEIREICNNKN